MSDDWESYFNGTAESPAAQLAATDWIVATARLQLDAWCDDAAAWDMPWQQAFDDEGLGY